MRYYYALLLCLGLASYAPIFASDFQINGLNYNILSLEEKTVAVVQNYPRGYSGNVVIPSEISIKGKTLKVVEIADKAFISSLNDLISVTIPSSIIRIGNEAFMGCRGLREVKGVIRASIGIRAFYNCVSLEKITLEGPSSIGIDAFYGCRIKEFSIPSGFDSFSPIDILNKCSSLSSIIVEESDYPLTILTNFPDEVRVLDKLYLGRPLLFKKNGYPSDPWYNMDYHFPHASKLIIGDRVSSLDVYYYDTPDLAELEVGKSIKAFPVFSQAHLKKIVMRSEVPPVVKNGFSKYIVFNCKVYVPSGSKNAYLNADGWRDLMINEY